MHHGGGRRRRAGFAAQAAGGARPARVQHAGHLHRAGRHPRPTPASWACRPASCRPAARSSTRLTRGSGRARSARFVRTFPAAVRTASRTLRRAAAGRAAPEHQRPAGLGRRRAARARAGGVDRARGARAQPVAAALARRLHPEPRAARRRDLGRRRDCFPPGAARPARARLQRRRPGRVLAGSRATALAVRAELGLGPGRPVVVVVGSRPARERPLAAARRLQPPAARRSRPGPASPAASAADYARTLRGRVKHALDMPLDNLEALLRDAAPPAGCASASTSPAFAATWPACCRPPTCSSFRAWSPKALAALSSRPWLWRARSWPPTSGPSRELLGPDAGRLVPPDPDSLATALADLLRSPDERARMGRAGRRTSRGVLHPRPPGSRDVRHLSRGAPECLTGTAPLDFVLLYAPPWSGPTRFSKHHLASYLAERGNRVLYVEAPLSPFGLRRGRAFVGELRDALRPPRAGRPAAVGAPLLSCPCRTTPRRG